MIDFSSSEVDPLLYIMVVNQANYWSFSCSKFRAMEPENRWFESVQLTLVVAHNV